MSDGFKLRLRESLGDWFKGCHEEIVNAELQMAQPLSDDPAILVRQLTEIEAMFERMNSMYADAQSYYYQAKRNALKKRGPDWTDLDRDVQMRAEIVVEQRLLTKMEGMVESIKNRLILGMSLRKSHVAERSDNRT